MGQVSANHTLCRREVVKALLADRKDVLVVTGLGSASYDVMAAGDNDLNYYLWAAMGSAHKAVSAAAARRVLVMMQVTESAGRSVIVPPTVVGRTVGDPVSVLVQAIVAT